MVVVALLSCFFELFDSEVVSDFLFRPLLDDVDMRSGIASESGVEMAAWRVGEWCVLKPILFYLL